MKGYKAFEAGLVCRGKQYAENTVFEEDSAKPCESGMHFCKEPLAVLRFYDAAKAKEFAEVEALDEAPTDDNVKFCTKKLKVGAKISLRDLVKAQIEFVRENCTNEQNSIAGAPAAVGDYGAATAGYRGAATAGYRGAATAGYSGAATAGDCGAATAGYSGAATAGNSGVATAGNYGVATAGNYGAATAGYSGAATAGDCGAATAGNYGAATAGYSGAATAGNYGAATAGDYGAATAGDYGAATAGDYGAATAGDYGAATSKGNVSVGQYGVGLVRGEKPTARGRFGAVLVFVREKANGDIEHIVQVAVDGKEIKENTWYTVDETGEVKEVECKQN